MIDLNNDLINPVLFCFFSYFCGFCFSLFFMTAEEWEEIGELERLSKKPLSCCDADIALHALDACPTEILGTLGISTTSLQT